MKKCLCLVLALSFSLALVFLMGNSALADGATLTKPAGINSQGRIVYDANNDQQNEIVFDAQDIYYLYKISR